MKKVLVTIILTLVSVKACKPRPPCQDQIMRDGTVLHTCR